jgi:hypothetical protein
VLQEAKRPDGPIDLKIAQAGSSGQKLCTPQFVAIPSLKVAMTSHGGKSNNSLPSTICPAPYQGLPGIQLPHVLPLFAFLKSTPSFFAISLNASLGKLIPTKFLPDLLPMDQR